MSTPELGDSYVGVSLSLHCGSAIAQGRIVKHTCDNHSNVIGRANEDPTLDTREYVVEFEDGEGLLLPPTPLLKACVLSVIPAATNMLWLSITMTIIPY